MSVDIAKVFTALPMTVSDFLSTQGQGCYIPAYQRPYSWEKKNADRLLEDALHGLDQLLVRANAVTFLGTIIAQHDTTYSTIRPLYRAEVCPRVVTIIDGQQRISTLAILNIIFHDLIRRYLAGIKRSDKPHDLALSQLCQRELKQLFRSFVLDMEVEGPGIEPLYPRIIRFAQDAWSKTEGQYKYTSPIAGLIWDYVNHTRGDASDKEFKYTPQEAEGERDEDREIIFSVFKSLRRSVKICCEQNARGKKTDNLEFPLLSDIITSDQFADAIWGNSLSQDIKRFVSEGSEDKTYANFVSALRLVILSRYINNRSAFTVVITTSEDDAFDMFEALNTTGAPLTAFETFKPKIIEAEGLGKYEDSPSKKSVDDIEEYFGVHKGASARHDATTDLLLPFRLALSGEKLTKKLNDQRRFLRDQYDQTPELADKRSLLKKMAYLANLMRSAWDLEKGQSPEIVGVKPMDESTIVCLQFLKHLKHSITLAPLLQFYQAALDANPDERTKKEQELEEAIKATCAYSALWRVVEGGANGIDGEYRSFMKTGVKDPLIPPLADKTESSRGTVSLSNYKRLMRNSLKGRGMGNKEDWIASAKGAPLGKHQAVARFFLTAAFHNAMIKKNDAPFMEAGRKGVADTLSSANWGDPSSLTIEHIAPQSLKGDWRNELSKGMKEPEKFEPAEIINTPGNLTILPKIENSVFRDRDWHHKQLFFKLVSAKTEKDQKQIAQQAKDAGLVLSEPATQMLKEGVFQKMSDPIGQYDGDWNSELINKRSENLCELFWDAVSPWLFEKV